MDQTFNQDLDQQLDVKVRTQFLSNAAHFPNIPTPIFYRLPLQAGSLSQGLLPGATRQATRLYLYLTPLAPPHPHPLHTPQTGEAEQLT